MTIQPGTFINLRLFGPARVHSIATDPKTGERVAMVFTREAQLTLSLRYCELVAGDK
jgi:hypothetical protein